MLQVPQDPAKNVVKDTQPDCQYPQVLQQQQQQPHGLTRHPHAYDKLLYAEGEARPGFAAATQLPQQLVSKCAQVCAHPPYPPRPQETIRPEEVPRTMTLTNVTGNPAAAVRAPNLLSSATGIQPVPPNQAVQQQAQTQPVPAATPTTPSSGSVIGGSGPASFFTSQMTAFKVWLQTANEKKPPATQLPILLQVRPYITSFISSNMPIF